MEGWTCSGCSTANLEASIICSNCGLTRPDEVLAPLIAPAQEPPPASDGASPDVPPASDGLAGWAAPNGDPTVASSAPVPMWRRLPIGWLLFGVLIVGGAIGGWYFNASRSSTGEVTKAGDLTANDLRVGDCFDLKDPAADQVDDVTGIPCTAAHEYETFFVGSLPAGAYPTEAAFQTFVEGSCQPAFDAYIGQVLADSDLDVFWFYPTDDAWRAGDRSVQCAVYHPRIHRLTESLKGSKQ